MRKKHVMIWKERASGRSSSKVPKAGTTSNCLKNVDDGIKKNVGDGRRLYAREKSEKQHGQGSLLDLRLVSFLSVLGGSLTDHCGPQRLRHTIIRYDILLSNKYLCLKSLLV